ncbi:hypothetical protein VNO77_32682 [Canavalia gladiata]|uniref:Proteoglycan 4-like n=1 Tax=Canavalia gladiata TaxID=3824 RepID=A0AAN9KT17_CANGL
MMAQRKQSFRFRIPWLSGPSESITRRPKDRPKSPPIQTDTSVPIQRPSKPSMITPSELPPTSPTKTEEPKNLSPPLPPTQPPESTQPKTLSPLPSSPKTHLESDNEAMKVPKLAAEETNTHPASSEQEKENMINSEPKQEEPEIKVRSPLRTPPKSPQTQNSFEPEKMLTQPADSEHQVSKTESPPHPSSPFTSDHTSEVSKRQTEETISPTLPTFQQEPEPKMKSPLKTKSPETETETSSQPQNLSVTHDDQKSTTQKTPLEAQIKPLQPEEKKKAVHESTKAGRKGKDTIPTTKVKDSFAKAFRADKREPRETVERKIMFSTSNPIGKDTTRVVSSSTDQGTRNVSSISSPHETTTVSSTGEKAPLQKGIKDDITKFVHKLTSSMHPTQPMDDKQFSVITLAGDNRGATMHLGSDSAKKEDSIHIHRAYKSDPEESTEVTTDVEEENKEEDMEEDEVGMAYVNSNIQSINNSLMFHGSITERDPGVQVTLPQKPTEPNDKPGLETQRTLFNINRAEKLAYQPTVRRRFIGPSSSDPNNTVKPHSQGCKLSCDKDIEDIEIL